MPNCIKLFCFILTSLVIIGLSSPAAVFAQTDPFYQSTTGRYESVETIKKDIRGLITENKELEDNYAELYKKWRRLQHNVLKQKAKRKEERQKQNMIAQQQGRSGPDQHSYIDELLDEPVYGDGTNLALKEEMEQYNEQITLLELKLADMQYHKRELELELKLLRVQGISEKEEKKTKEKQIAINLQKILEKEKELSDAVSKNEERLLVMPDQMPALERENLQLKEMIYNLKKKKEFKERELAILADKKVLKEKSSENILAQVQDEKYNLHKRVKELEREHEDLNNQISRSLIKQQRKKELIEEIIYFDRENQKLQAKINELSDKITYFEF